MPAALLASVVAPGGGREGREGTLRAASTVSTARLVCLVCLLCGGTFDSKVRHTERGTAFATQQQTSTRLIVGALLSSYGGARSALHSVLMSCRSIAAALLSSFTAAAARSTPFSSDVTDALFRVVSWLTRFASPRSRVSPAAGAVLRAGGR